MSRIYNGQGSSWANATAYDLPITYPEVLKKYAGPRSTVNRKSSRKSFAGMGTSIMVDTSTLTSQSSLYADPSMGAPLQQAVDVDGVPTYKVVAPGFENVDSSVVPFLTPTGSVAQAQPTAAAPSFDWTTLLLIAAGLYILTRN